MCSMIMKKKMKSKRKEKGNKKEEEKDLLLLRLRLLKKFNKTLNLNKKKILMNLAFGIIYTAPLNCFQM